MDLLYPFLYSLFLCAFSWGVAGVHKTTGAVLVALMTTINCIVGWVVWFVGDQFMLINECILRIPS